MLVVNEETCVGCGQCIPFCPTEALTQVYHRADEREYLLDHFRFDEGVDWG
ncbi:MAG: hypothetical protein COS88_05200 [Chloroflexi bacterium CG07_land_8_20_14_0_80_51_10]|nr:MAG: hypothetical protein COS88_05200 [Chloroflexi bacterium CG07_land_8_20_14_0_80_51_10]